MENFTEFRASMEKRLFDSYIQVLPQDKYDQMVEFWKGLSDHNFIQIVAQSAKYAPNPDTYTLKDKLNHIREGQQLFKTNANNLAAKTRPVRFLAEPENDELWQQINRSHPSDIIRLTKESDHKLIHLWGDSNKTCVTENGVLIPSDLFFAETIPLKDVHIVVDETESGGAVCQFRVVIFDDYTERTRQTTENDYAFVGAIIQYLTEDISIAISIGVLRGMDVCLCGTFPGYHNLSPALRQHYMKNVSQTDINQMFISFMETWYGIQIALLHPLVRDIFRKPRTVPLSNNKKNAKSVQKRKVRYIKEHVLNAHELGKAVNGVNGTSTRRTLVWYVIGHWRSYSDGRKVFIKPYWKGALRKIKHNLTDREREIAQVSHGGQQKEVMRK